METRGRSRRAASAAASENIAKTQRPTRAKRQKKPASTAPEVSRRESQFGAPTPIRPVRLVPSSQIPRRGARLSAYANSVVSIATSLPKADDSQYSERSPISRASPESRDGNQELDHDGNDVTEEEDADLKDALLQNRVRDRSLPDLEKAADELIELLKNPNVEDDTFRPYLHLKHKALHTIREIFEEPGTAPFIDWASIVPMYEDPHDAEPAAAILVQANIAAAFNAVRAIQFGLETDLYSLFDNFNALFPDFFAVPGKVHKSPELVLDIRTWYFIELVTAQTGKFDIKKIAADAFCPPIDDSDEEPDYAHLFVHGPFNKLWDEDQEEAEAELCSQRITEIMAAGHNDRKSHGLNKLREKFPLGTVLDDIVAWLLEAYETLKTEYSEQDGLLPIAPPTAEEDDEEIIDGEDFEVEDSQTDIGESQPIIRAGTADQEATLYRNVNSLRILDGRATSSTPVPVPPSNQQQAVPPPGVPRDYDYTNAQLLRTPAPEFPADSRSQPQGNGEGPSRANRVEAEEDVEDLPPDFGGGVEEEEDDEDEEDPFETDNRPVNKGKRAAISNSMPPPKRPRTAAPQSSNPQPPTSSNPNPPISSNPVPPSSRTQPPISTMASVDPSATPEPSQPNFSAIKATKVMMSQRARLNNQTAFKQRHGWTEPDSAMLITLVRERHAAWAAIEQNDSHKFEHPRNQQAYRDKARNLKVDFLLTDAILPPGFDLVALGNKERKRLVSMGKNPDRREKDIDENGNAISTEYRPLIDREDVL